MAMLTQLTETVTQLAVRVDGISGGPRSGEVEVKQAPGESPPVTAGGSGEHLGAGHFSWRGPEISESNAETALADFIDEARYARATEAQALQELQRALCPELRALFRCQAPETQKSLALATAKLTCRAKSFAPFNANRQLSSL